MADESLMFRPGSGRRRTMLSEYRNELSAVFDSLLSFTSGIMKYTQYPGE